MLTNLYTLLGCVALVATIAGVVGGLIAARAWRETAEALALRLAMVEGEVKDLKAQHEQDQTLIGRLTHQRDRLLRTVRLLTARVGQLERRLRDAGIPADHTSH